MNGCAWFLLFAAALAAALALGLLPAWLLGLAAAPAAFLLGHYVGYRKAVDDVETAGHAKAASDARGLRQKWRVW